MEKKAVSGIMLTLLLIGILTLAFNVQPVKTEPTTIVVPDDYPTIREAVNNANEGDTIYVRAGTYYENLVVKKTVSLLGENRETTVIIGDWMATVHLSANNITISGFTIQNSGRWRDNYGIFLNYDSDDNTITGNRITNNTIGVYLSFSSGNTFRDNDITGNKYNFGIEGLNVSDLIQDIDPSNTVDGKPIYYWVNQHDRQVPTDAGYVAVVNSTKIILRDLTLTRNLQGAIFAYTTDSIIANVNVSNDVKGIMIWESVGSSIIGNTVTNNGWGIRLWRTSGNTINHNTISNNAVEGIFLHISNGSNIYENTISENDYKDIFLWGSNGNTIYRNKLTNSGRAIQLDISHGNVITGNTIASSNTGIYARGSDDNMITGNTISNNLGGIGVSGGCDNMFSDNTISNNRIVGIEMYSDDNIFYHNSFINNTEHARVFGFGNTWDNGYPSGGNYWSGYNGTDLFSGPYQNETGSDGIGDTPYTMDENNRDRFPLIHPYGYVPSPDLTGDGKVDIDDIATAALAFGTYPSHPRWKMEADMNQDSKIDIKDLVLIAKNFGKTYP